MPTVDATTIPRVNEAASRGVDFKPVQRKLTPIERKRLVVRRCKRKPTLFRKCNEYAQLCDSQIWLVLQPNGSDQKETFHSDPASNFPFETWANIRDRGYPDPILHEPANMPQVHDVNNRGQDADPDDMPCEPRFVLRDTTIALISPGLPGQPLDEDMFDVMSGMDSGDDGMEVVSDGGDPVQCHPRNTGFRAAYSGATKQDPGHAIAVRQPHTPDVAPKASRPVPKQAPPQVVVAHSHTRHVAAERPTGSTSSRSPAHGVALPCVTPCHGGTDNLGIAVGPSRSDGGATGQAKTRINSQDSVARYGSRSFAGTVFQNVSGPAVHSSQPLYISPPRSPTKGDSRRQGTRQQISEVGQARASMREELTTSTPTKRIQPFRATRLSKGAAKVRHRGRNALRRTRQGSQ